MNGSWSIGRVAGIPVRLHWSLLAIAAFVVVTQGLGAVGSVLGAVLLFASIVVHELAHALTARLYGVRTRDIVLTPIGGIARLEGMATGMGEVAIALAGPIASLALAAGAFGVVWLLPLKGLALSIVTTLAWSNAMLGLFNLIPAFPMDGGRVLRGLLASRIGLSPATRLAATVGRVAAVLMGIGGLATGNVSLALIAVYVWMASGRERDAVLREEREASWEDWSRYVAPRRGVGARSGWLDDARREPRAWDAQGRPIHVELVDTRPRAQPTFVWTTRSR